MDMIQFLPLVAIAYSLISMLGGGGLLGAIVICSNRSHVKALVSEQVSTIPAIQRALHDRT